MHLILGSTTIDFLARSDDRFPTRGGEHFQASNLAWCREPLQMVVGGNGANTALVLARLGAPVRLMSAVGRDALGELAARRLADAGVDCALLLQDAGRATATTVVASDADHQRLIFHHPGAYTALQAAPLLPQLLTTPRPESGRAESGRAESACAAFLITSWPLLDGLRPDYGALLGAARAAGYFTVADIGPAIGAPVRLAEVAPLLPAIDLLLANEHELATCFEADATQDSAAAEPHAARALALLTAGARTLIVKAGEAGSTCFVRAGSTQEVVAQHVPAFCVPVAQTVGAGDAYAAGLIDALGRGAPLLEAMRYGSAVAALTVAAGSTLASPRPDAVARLLDAGKTRPLC